MPATEPIGSTPPIIGQDPKPILSTYHHPNHERPNSPLRHLCWVRNGDFSKRYLRQNDACSVLSQVRVPYILPLKPNSGFHISVSLYYQRRSLSPRVLTRGSAAASLLGLRDRIPLGAWMFFSCECCVLMGIILCDAPIPRPEESYCARACVLLNMIRCNITLYTYSRQVDRGHNKKERKLRPLLKWLDEVLVLSRYTD